ncbi:MAG: hypothetical protein JWM25_897 [Thermoleophilia bacterium]|nr:hypothetical protein [Thermoleophilia bacterium]MCZ4496314.1 hypothetical protein [Thermoleophilia bacterium]
MQRPDAVPSFAMPAPLRHPALLALLCAGLLLLTACGGTETKRSDDSASTAPEATTTVEPDADLATDDEPPTDGEPVPTRMQIGLGRRLDALVLAYRPVTLRMNYLVAAVQLRDDAVDGDASKAVITERSGAVRVELRRLQSVLTAARVQVARRSIATGPDRQLQQLLLAGIDARARAVRELEVSLNVDADPEVGDTDRTAADRTWRASWNDAVRSARTAMTLQQDTREAANLEPAREDSLR